MAETIDEQFIEFIVKALVGEPDQVKIVRTIDERGVLLELHVDPEDLGRVIGRSGGTAKSIRTLLRALGVKNDARYNLKIVDTNGGGRPHRDERPIDTPVAGVDTAAPVADAAAETAPDQPAAEVAAEPETPAEPEAPAEEEDKLSRHREDLKEFTDFDI